MPEATASATAAAALAFSALVNRVFAGLTADVCVAVRDTGDFCVRSVAALAGDFGAIFASGRATLPVVVFDAAGLAGFADREDFVVFAADLPRPTFFTGALFDLPADFEAAERFPLDLVFEADERAVFDRDCFFATGLASENRTQVLVK